MDDPDWYEVASGAALCQGDILLSYPIASVIDLPAQPFDDYEPEVDIRICDVVVMTQTCDLSHSKVNTILLAQIHKWADFVKANPANPMLKSEAFRKALVAGNAPNHFLFHKRVAEPAFPWSVADFHHLFITAKESAQHFASGLTRRLRLKSPYREHLSQAFARYFMRVGLPLDAVAFIKEGKID